jgi:hypothetical protein
LLEPYRRVSSGPLAELRLADVVDIHPGAADVALVDLDPMQMGATMRLAIRRAPIVLPKVRAQAVVQRPFDRLGVAVHAGPLVADDGFPASQVRRAGVAAAYFSASRTTGVPRVTKYDNCINYHINVTRHVCITAIGQADPVLLASTCAVRRCPRDSKLATAAAGAAVTTSRHTGVEAPADARPTAAPSSDRVISTTDA